MIPAPSDGIRSKPLDFWFRTVLASGRCYMPVRRVSKQMPGELPGRGSAGCRPRAFAHRRRPRIDPGGSIMKTKRIVALLGVVALVAALAALSGAASTAKAAQHKGVTITIWDYFDAPPNGTAERNALMAVAQKWAKKTGNKVVNPGYVANKENKFIQAAPAGQGPDILMEPHDRIGSFIVPGLLASAPKSLLTVAQKGNYVPVSLQACTYKGKLFGLPWARETYFMFYNKDLVKTPPATWC